MMTTPSKQSLLAWLLQWLLLQSFAAAQNDTLGIAHGYTSLTTAKLSVKLVKDAQVLASLTPAGSTFDFLPFDYISSRAANGQYHWGDITLRYRTLAADGVTNTSAWHSADSTLARKAVTPVTVAGTLAAAKLGPTLPSGIPLTITRSWLDVNGDLGLRFDITSTSTTPLEIGSLGFPAEFNSIFTWRTAEQIQALCSLSDPYIGLDGGFIRTSPVSGNGAALVVTPLGGTARSPLEAYHNLNEPYVNLTQYGSQTFEGLYEWLVHSKAYAGQEWSGIQPWNPPTSRVLQPGGSFSVGVRFSVAGGGIRGIEDTVRAVGTPVVKGIPGFIIPRDLPAQLLVHPPSGVTVSSIAADPAGAFTVSQDSSNPSLYSLTPSSSVFGRVRVTITYSDASLQTVHYYIINTGPSTIANLGTFLTTKQWFTNMSDPFGRAPSVISYDYSVQNYVLQDDRVWIAGLSDEAGAGSFLAACIKQAVQPSAAEITKLEQFVNTVMWGRIQTANYGVRKSIFFHEPALVPGYTYDPSIDWTGWESWDRADAYDTGRAYDYVHVAASYWGMYRAARAYPELVKVHDWTWYLNQSYETVMAATATDSAGNPLVGYASDGLMGETVFGFLLQDLRREGLSSEFSALEARMRGRAAYWNSEAVPFGSEMAWDSTGQEGVYYWSKYFGYATTAAKALGTVLGFQPTVPHWGWNGNARRYWDNIYGGKLRRIERQIHHYGSGLNALVALSAFRTNTSDNYLLRIGYGGMNGPLSNIHADGFAAASFHSWPDTLAWDAYSGDYGPNFVGLVLGSATYIAQDPDLGLVAYGGAVQSVSAQAITAKPRDAARRSVFVAPLGLLITADAGAIQSVTYTVQGPSVSVTLGQLCSGPVATAAVLWLETTSGKTNYTVTSPQLTQSRLGWKVPLGGASASATVTIGPA